MSEILNHFGAISSDSTTFPKLKKQAMISLQEMAEVFKIKFPKLIKKTLNGLYSESGRLFGGCLKDPCLFS